MFKKLLLLISTLLVSLKLSFATSNLADFNLLDSFNIFGTFYELLNGNNHILDGIVIIVFFIGFFQISNHIFAKIFKGSGHSQARKGASAIISILVTGALIIHNPGKSFTSFYGGLLLFYLSLAMMFGIFIPWVKKTWVEGDNWGKSTVLISIWALVIIVLTNAIAVKITGDGGVVDNLLINIIIYIFNRIVIVFVSLIFIGIFVWVRYNKESKKISKTPTPKQAEDQSKAELKFARDKIDRINELTIDIDHEIGDLFK